jgi:hypothetical protein
MTHPHTPWRTQMRVQKWKHKKKELGVHSLAQNILGVREVCWRFKIGIKKSDKHVNYSHGPAQTKQ